MSKSSFSRLPDSVRHLCAFCAQLGPCSSICRAPIEGYWPPGEDWSRCHQVKVPCCRRLLNQQRRFKIKDQTRSKNKKRSKIKLEGWTQEACGRRTWHFLSTWSNERVHLSSNWKQAQATSLAPEHLIPDEAYLDLPSTNSIFLDLQVCRGPIRAQVPLGTIWLEDGRIPTGRSTAAAAMLAATIGAFATCRGCMMTSLETHSFEVACL